MYDDNNVKAAFNILRTPHIFGSILQDIDRIMKMTDTDGDGSIDYNELCQKVFGQSCD